MSKKPQDDVLITYEDFDIWLKLLREETLKGLGEKQNSKHDVLALMPIYSKRFWTRNNFVT